MRQFWPKWIHLCRHSLLSLNKSESISCKGMRSTRRRRACEIMAPPKAWQPTAPWSTITTRWRPVQAEDRSVCLPRFPRTKTRTKMWESSQRAAKLDTVSNKLKKVDKWFQPKTWMKRRLRVRQRGNTRGICRKFSSRQGVGPWWKKCERIIWPRRPTIWIWLSAWLLAQRKWTQITKR